MALNSEIFVQLCLHDELMDNPELQLREKPQSIMCGSSIHIRVPDLSTTGEYFDLNYILLDTCLNSINGGTNI